MDMVGISLREALKGGGCPICRLVEKFEDEEIETILYEHPNDPEVRKKFREGLGLCPHHAWKILHKALSNPLLGPLGVAVIYEDVLRHYLENPEESRPGECFLCRLVEGKERATVEAFAERLEDLLDEYQRSPSVLCRRHYQMLLRAVEREKPELAARLREIQREKLRKLDELMRAFIDSFDYRAERPATKEERESLRVGLEALVGRPFGRSESEGERKRKWGRWRLR
ncbi:DUF6062 family protein [Thermococcus sp.]|uniref:DUF6062 family protein n=1 Tax=Thermococcus sp. TaxID=35749 RepID=UPI002618ADBF|nr:DUF6062 family protein [Thermococcus sp.]